MLVNVDMNEEPLDMKDMTPWLGYAQHVLLTSEGLNEDYEGECWYP